MANITVLLDQRDHLEVDLGNAQIVYTGLRWEEDPIDGGFVKYNAETKKYSTVTPDDVVSKDSEFVSGKAIIDYVEENSNASSVTKTSELINDGDGQSKFATEQHVATHGGKIDSISVDGVKQEIDENKNVNLVLEGYVKDTDYASNTTAGIVMTDTNFGTMMVNRTKIALRPATEATILAKSQSYHPLTPKNLDYAVKVGVTTNTIALTEDEKLKAQDWLGTRQYTDQKVSDLINSAPETLDTLGELATAFEDNKDVVDALNGAIVNKADKVEVSAVELNSHKQIILGADGVLEGNVYNYTVQNADSVLPYRTNGTKFLMDLHLPIVGPIDTTKEYVITFGDTVYYVYSILKGQEHSTMADLKQVDKYSNEVGYRFITEMTFFDNSEFKGFAIIPTVSVGDVLSLDSDEMDRYIAEGGLTQGQLAICNKVVTNGYTEGSIYKFEITYPDTYSWTELTTYESKPQTHALILTGTNVLTSQQTFSNHVTIMVEFETDGIHAGFDCVLHPYDDAVCFVTYDVLVGGQPNFGTAYLDDAGHVVINVPNGLTFTNVKAHYMTYGIEVDAVALGDGNYSLFIK